MGWLDSIGSSFLGSGTGSAAQSGWGELAMSGVGSYLKYDQANKDRKEKLAMFDKQFGAEQNQLAFQNAEYLKKKKAEEDAWSGYSNPYATTMV